MSKGYSQNRISLTSTLTRRHFAFQLKSHHTIFTIQLFHRLTSTVTSLLADPYSTWLTAHALTFLSRWQFCQVNCTTQRFSTCPWKNQWLDILLTRMTDAPIFDLLSTCPLMLTLPLIGLHGMSYGVKLPESSSLYTTPPLLTVKTTDAHHPQLCRGRVHRRFAVR